MSNHLKLCRLCLSNENLIDVFYSRESCSGKSVLRTSILLCTGVNILPEDDFSKYVCKACCDLCLKLLDFRKTALANAKALKQYHQEISSTFPVNIQEIVELNNLLIRNPNIRVQSRKAGDVSKDSNTDTDDEADLAVHPTVLNILRIHHNINLPNNILRCNMAPTVVLDKKWEAYSFANLESDTFDSGMQSKADFVDIHSRINDSALLLNGVDTIPILTPFYSTLPFNETNSPPPLSRADSPPFLEAIDSVPLVNSVESNVLSRTQMKSPMHLVQSNVEADLETSESDLLEVIREVTNVPWKSRKKRKRRRKLLQTKSNKRYKKNGQFPVLCNKISSLPLHGMSTIPRVLLKRVDTTRKETYDMFSQKNDVSFLRSLFARYKKKISDTKTSIGVNTYSVAESLVEAGSGTFVIKKQFIECFMHKIPVTYEYSEGDNFQVIVIDNNKDEKCPLSEMWNLREVIDLKSISIKSQDKK